MDLISTNLTYRVHITAILFCSLYGDALHRLATTAIHPLINKPVVNANGMLMPDRRKIPL